jgi:transcriptional regulator with PAS, ATPase and Fis domain
VAFDLPPEGTIVLGRGPEAHIRLEDRSVSRLHARIYLGLPLRIEDLGSANGTRLDGFPLTAHHVADVAVGAVIELGDVRVVTARTETDKDVAPMTRVRDLVARFASSDVSVILVGETGAGKEILAGEIHQHSRRASGPFLRLNCAALDTNLIESELFGYERGAFTGATHAKVGLLEAASGGTVLLDEIGEMSLAVQARLLRVLESREVLRLGALQARPIDVRFVCATHRDLDTMVILGQFRQDLLFRLSGVTIALPPLRERTDEIPALAETLLAEACARAGKPLLPLSEGASLLLRSYRWPGNVRELRSVLERAVRLADDAVVSTEHLIFGRQIPNAAASVPPPSSKIVEDAAARREASIRAPDESPEAGRIRAALEQCGGNQKEAAKLLGLSPRMLVYRIDKLGLPRPRKKK